MQDFIQKFIESLDAAGISPSNNSEIIADDCKNRYHIIGDKPRSKNGVYQLKIEDGFAVGWAMSYKNGEVHKFSSKNFRKFTREEKAEFSKKLEKERELKKKQRDKITAEASEKAAKIWKRASKVGGSPYLERKKCKLNNARIYKNLVLIPAYIDNKVSTLQFIAESGEKRFMRGGNIEGGYFPLATKEDDKSVLLLCEGFSTGDSIRQATGLPVIVCFNAGNLLPVAQILRKKYPKSTLIFCADNDEFTEINGEKVNIGLVKARDAAVKTGGGAVIFPEFENNENTKYSDFNDAFLALGTKYVKDRIESALTLTVNSVDSNPDKGSDVVLVDVQKPDDYPASLVTTSSNQPVKASEDWREALAFDSKGNYIKNNMRNALLFLLNDPYLAGAFAYDEFHQTVYCMKDITNGNSDFKIHPLNDSDIMQVCLHLEKLEQIKDERKVGGLINHVARLNTINPAIDYFNSLEWDGVDRLEHWLEEGFGATEPELYLAAIGKKWIVAAVKRVFEPGCKFDHMLMLEGLQGLGKSSALELMAAFGEKIDKPYHQSPEESYYTDALTFDKISDKDSMMLTSGAIIVALEELVGKGKKMDDDIKRWITLRSDKGRLPYAKFVTDMKRQFVLAGTTNNFDYLKDPTGNRRYWCFTVTKVDKKYINDNREQIWAEAVVRYKEGLYLGLEGKENELAEIEQKKRLEKDVWESAVKNALIDLGKYFEISDLLTAMNLNLKDQDARAAGRVRNILKGLGMDNKPTRVGNEVKRMWSKEDVQL